MPSVLDDILFGKRLSQDVTIGPLNSSIGNQLAQAISQIGGLSGLRSSNIYNPQSGPFGRNELFRLINSGLIGKKLERQLQSYFDTAFPKFTPSKQSEGFAGGGPRGPSGPPGSLTGGITLPPPGSATPAPDRVGPFPKGSLSEIINPLAGPGGGGGGGGGFGGFGGGGGGGAGGGGAGGGGSSGGFGFDPGGGFSFRGTDIPPPFTTPQSGLIDQLFARVLDGVQREPRDINALDPADKNALSAQLNKLLGSTGADVLPQDLVGQLRGTITELLGSPGLPEEALRNAQNRVREGLATRERELTQRRGAGFAGRNAFGSGPQVRAVEGIETDISQNLANELTKIGLEDAAAAERSRALGLSGGTNLGQLLLGAENVATGRQSLGTQGMLGLGQLGLGEQSTAIQEALGRQGLDLNALRLAISRELGQGQLDLGQSELELQRSLQELLQNLFINENFFGTGGEGGGNPPNLGFNFGFGGGGMRDPFLPF